MMPGVVLFLPTPSARRATPTVGYLAMFEYIFLPTPSARRATCGSCNSSRTSCISTHALREEGDANHGVTLDSQVISTHALREEGDLRRWDTPPPFYSISPPALREEGDLTCQVLDVFSN